MPYDREDIKNKEQLIAIITKEWFRELDYIIKGILL